MYFAYRFLVSFVLFLLFTTTAVAQYSQNQLRYPGDSLGLTIRSGNSLEWTRQVSTGSDGITYFVWGEYGDDDFRIRAAALDSLGNLLWIRTVNDRPIDQESPAVLAVPGGCIVAWWETLNSAWEGTVYAQKISASGITQWPTLGDTLQGVLIGSGNSYYHTLQLESDGNDGAILVWGDQRSSLEIDLWGIRILGNGQIAPGFRNNGNPIAVAPRNQAYHDDFTICRDGYGGVWVAWADNRSTGYLQVYIQRIRGNGTLQFDSTGHALTWSNQWATMVKIAPDGRGGAFLVWRASLPTEDIYMQRIDSLGNSLWSPDSVGVAVINATGNQANPKIVFSSIDTCIVAWEDFRNDPSGQSDEDIYINKVTGTTSLIKLWGENGSPVCIQIGPQNETRITSDGVGGAVLTWVDTRNHNWYDYQDVYSQRINSNGESLWGENGRSIASATGDQYFPHLTRVNNRFLFLWRDSRNGSEPIYRTMWDANGNPVNGLPIGGVETIPDIAWSCDKVSALSNEPERFITTWVDRRMLPFANRVYYSVNNSITGEPIGCEPHGNPVTLDSNNQISQHGGQQYSSPLIVSAPDLGLMVIYVQTVGDVHTLNGQKISRNGERMWGDFGSSLSSDIVSPDYLSGVPDGMGGALLCYTAVDLTSPNFYNKVRLQHVSSTGSSLLNLDGIVIDSSDLEQSYSCVTKSGENYYVGYTELYDEFNLIYSVHVAKINLQGEVIWNYVYADSTRNQSTGNRQSLQLISASQGGVIAYWQEYRSDTNDGAQIYAQKIDSLGNALWTNGGLRLGTSSMDQSNADAIQSGSNYWFVWQDVRDAGNPQIYCQRVSESGALHWQGGLRLNPVTTPQQYDKITTGNNASVYIFWTQWMPTLHPERSDPTVFGVHLDSLGNHADASTWTGQNGVGVLSGYKGYVSDVATDGWGGAIVGINRIRTHFEDNWIVAIQRVFDRTCVDVKEVVSEALPVVYSLEQNYPNPFNGETKFRFTLPVSGVVKVVIFDVMGREVITPVHRQFQAGTFDVHWNGKSNTGMKVGSGVYFYRIEAGKFVSTRKMVMVQ